VNLIDNADVYSRGAAESIIGRALNGRRDQVLLASKARFPMGPGANDAGLSRHHLSVRLLRPEDGQAPRQR
jgi:aryl-alcohol dehydrogenase-like predicted oxidoreductase